MNIFEQASRKGLRFTTIRGVQSTDDLWHMPLQSQDGFDLDNLAKKLKAELNAVTIDESFVVTTENPIKVELTLKLEIIKHIIDVKLQEWGVAVSVAIKNPKLAARDLSVEEIHEQLAQLS